MYAEGLIVVIADGFGVSDGFVAMDLRVGLSRLLDIALTNCRRVYREHGDLLFETCALASGARGRVPFENQRLKHFTAILAFEIEYRHGGILSFTLALTLDKKFQAVKRGVPLGGNAVQAPAGGL
jgi:hypothetical protein